MKNIQIQIFKNKNYTISLFFIYNFFLIINNLLSFHFINYLERLLTFKDAYFNQKIEYI